MKYFNQYYNEITKCHLFSDMSCIQVTRALELLHHKFSKYAKNQYLHRSDENFDCFGLVLYGRVKVMIDDIEGNSAIMSEVTAGNTFGESLCFMKRNDSNVYILASEDCGVVWLSPSELFQDRKSELKSEIERRFVEMLASRTLVMNDRIQILSKLTLREKIITFLTFSKRDAGCNELDIPLSREEMSLYFGTNRSALSRELSHLRSEGLIDYKRNHFKILF